MTRDYGDHPIPSHPVIFQLSLQTMHLSNSSLAWPLGDAWVPLGCRLGDPRVTQSQPHAGRGSELLKTQNATEFPLRQNQLLHAHSSQRTYSILVQFPDGSHARTSSLAQVMSFATLCLTLVHISSTWP